MGAFEFDHAGAVVNDLVAAVEFFLALGFVRVGEADVEGPWMDKTIGIDNGKARIVMVSAPDGSGKLELSTFERPAPGAIPAYPSSNDHGFRHLAYTVPDVDFVVSTALAAGYSLVGEVVEYADVYRLAYVRGPEGLIVEFAQEL